MTLKDEGWRYVCRGHRDFRWIHPLEMLPSYIDCTDMSDSEFQALVISHYQGEAEM